MRYVAGIVLIWLFVQTVIIAQPPNPGPVDGGIGFLIAAGITYGIVKLRKKQE